MKKIKVVIVEDDQEIRKLVEEILSYEPDIAKETGGSIFNKHGI